MVSTLTSAGRNSQQGVVDSMMSTETVSEALDPMAFLAVDNTGGPPAKMVHAWSFGGRS
jgi:hypothetical protein